MTSDEQEQRRLAAIAREAEGNYLRRNQFYNHPKALTPFEAMDTWNQKLWMAIASAVADAVRKGENKNP